MARFQEPAVPCELAATRPRNTRIRYHQLLRSTFVILGTLAMCTGAPAATTAEIRLSPSDTAGLAVAFHAADGHPLSDAEPLLRWNDAPPATSTRGPDGAWTLRWPDSDLVATVAAPEPLAGGAQLALTLENQGESPQAGVLLPPLTEPLRADPARVSPQHLLIQRPDVAIGTLGWMKTWLPREFWPDIVALKPAAGADLMLTAVLVNASRANQLELAPGAVHTATLYLSAIPGDRNAALRELYRVRGGYRVEPASYDMSDYHSEDLAWVSDVVAAWITWSWDVDVMDPRTGEYRLSESLAAAEQQIGGYDIYMFWPFWPRAGLDPRFQFDHFEDMPGGLAGLRQEIQQARDAHGTRFIIAHCIWSETARDGSPAVVSASHRRLVETAVALDADGVIMDVSSTTPAEVRKLARAAGRDLMPYAEFDPNWEQSQTNLMGRIHDGHPMPAFNLKRYMLPHHQQLRVCNPGLNGPLWERDFTLSLFNGHGIEINHLLGQDLPASKPAFELLAPIFDLLRTNRASFRSPDWQPFIESRNPHVWINRWPTATKTLYTLLCATPAGHAGPLLTLELEPGEHVVDLWRQRPAEVETVDGKTVVSYTLPPYIAGRANGTGDYTVGCLAVLPQRLSVELDRGQLTVNVTDPQPGETVEIWRHRFDPAQEPTTAPAAPEMQWNLLDIFGQHTNEAVVVRLRDADGQLVDLTAVPEANERFLAIDPPTRTAPVKDDNPPAGMLRIDAPPFDYVVQLTAPVWQPTYNQGAGFHAGPPSEPQRVELRPFWIDRYPVTNAEFKTFLDATGYRPEHPAKFLAHWNGDAPPPELADHPVVYVSYADATAYATWAGKRLPTEEEWQAAAGGASDQPWPWGEEPPSAERCNFEVGATTPVGAHPAGASPFGVEDLVGNVWQWTAPRYRSTHAQVVFLRGGSWYQTPGMWFVRGGPRPINDHQPLPLFGPAMNRLATVGFRCVQDARPE
jgi:formylglycine-generating enzyme required for sulfatase activity